MAAAQCQDDTARPYCIRPVDQSIAVRVHPEPTLKPTLNFVQRGTPAVSAVSTWTKDQLDKGEAMTEHTQDDRRPEPLYVQQPSEPVPPYSPPAPQLSGTQPSYQPVPMSPADQRTWAMATHLSAFLAAFVALSFLGPLIMYIIFRDRGAFIRHHSAEALNFQLTMWIGLIISFPLMLVLIGFVTAGAIAVTMLVCHILGAVAAREGRDYRYPFTIRFVS